MKQQAKVPASHKDLLKSAVASAERDHQAAASEELHIRSKVKDARDAMEQLQQRYEQACLAAAQGNPKAEDPARLIAERDQRKHTLRGLEQMHRLATDAVSAAAMKTVKAQGELQTELDREDSEQFEAAVTVAQKNREAAKTAFNEAEKALNTAVWYRDFSPRAFEIKARGRA